LIVGKIVHNKGSPTQRAPDGWKSARFQAVFRLEAGPGKAASSRPAHPRVTPAVGLPNRITKGVRSKRGISCPG